MTNADQADIRIRAATIADAEAIVAHRRAMFFDMGHRDTHQLNAMITAFRPWLREKIASNEYLAWMGTSRDGTIVAGLGLWLMDWPPHLIGPGSRRGNILNVYTERSYRRQGIAKRLMEVALEWCKANGIQAVILHASEEGRGLYQKLGFEPTNEMRLMLARE